MTHPGDPGYAAASRADAEAVETGTTTDAARRRRRPWTLHRRLLAIVALLLIAVSAVIGVLSVAVFHTTSVGRLDASLRETASRATDAAPPGFPSDPRSTVLEFLRVPGQPVGRPPTRWPWRAPACSCWRRAGTTSRPPRRR